MNLFDTGGATFSPCRTWRYRLWRTWSGGRGTINFLMLNPSTADEENNDPTVERCETRARAWGYERLIVTNLFAFRATSPLDMKAAPDPVGPGNDAEIRVAALESECVVCAWGQHGDHMGRSAAVLSLLSGIDLWALRVNLSGEPGHPLYLPYSAMPVRFNHGGQ